MYMIIKLFFFIQPRKVKFKVNREALITFVSENGLPPRKASCKKDGYWYKAIFAIVLEVHTADHVTDHVISFEESPTRKTVPDCVMKIKSPPSSLSLLNEVSK